MTNNVAAKPLHDRVIVRPAPAEEKTSGGIIIPDTPKKSRKGAPSWLQGLAKKTNR